jgi:hypothetical protein
MPFPEGMSAAMVARRNLVLASLEADGGDRCVDIFRRPDDTFGFEEYRRDSEDGRGWFRIGNFGDEVFPTETDARVAATRALPWLGHIAGR